ncbi:glycosyl hydrolase [Halobacteriales archaeon QS_4_62_28]|nr:MAG: glycosyl hydrolase [Halobacteriales archaeon QS_4_62_28]
MKLQSIHDGTVYATDGREVYRETGESISAGTANVTLPGGMTFKSVGSLPVESSGLAGITERLQTARPWKGLLGPIVGSYQTVNLWAFSSSMLATVGQRVFVSADGGETWTQRLSLPPTSPRMGVLPSSVCSDGDVTYLAEYPLDVNTTPRVYRSTDGGWSWETYLELPDVRHVHSVSIDPYSGDCWLTTGDTDDACRLLRLRDDEMRVVGGGSQDWRIVEPAFTRDGILWGVDCGYTEVNRIFRLPRSRLDSATPTPEPVGQVESSVYYAETFSTGGTEWVVLSTAAESGGDRTAPDEDTHGDQVARVVAASAETGFTEWTTLATYRRRTTPADWSVTPSGLPTANAYVFLASCPDRGLFVNPFNTATANGDVRRIPLSTFADLSSPDGRRAEVS